MEKESDRGLRLQARRDFDLLCHTHPSTAPESSTSSQRIAVPGFPPGGRDPNHLFPSSPGGEAFFNACLLRRTHQAMKSWPASVATVWPHLDAECCPILAAVGTGCSSTRVLGASRPAAIVPKAEAKGAASLSSFTTFSHAAAATPPCPSPRFVQSCSSLPTLPARQEGPGPPFSVKWLSRGCPSPSELVTKSKLGALPGDNKWGGIL